MLQFFGQASSLFSSHFPPYSSCSWSPPALPKPVRSMQGVEEQKDYELSSNQAAGNSNQDRRVAPVTFSQHFGMDSKPAARPFLVSAPTFISADHSLPSMQQISPTIWHTAQIPPISTPSAFQHVSCPPPNSYNAHQELRPTNPTNASFRASDTLPLLIYQSQSSASIKKSKYLSYFDPSESFTLCL